MVTDQSVQWGSESECLSYFKQQKPLADEALSNVVENLPGCKQEQGSSEDPAMYWVHWYEGDCWREMIFMILHFQREVLSCGRKEHLQARSLQTQGHQVDQESPEICPPYQQMPGLLSYYDWVFQGDESLEQFEDIHSLWEQTDV